MSLRSLSGLLALTVSAIFSDPAFATTYFVRKTGNNASAGTSAASAYQTVTKAVSSAQPGDVVYVGAGTYTEPVTTVRSGTDTAPIRFLADTNGEYTGDSGTVKITYWSSSVIAIGHQFIEFDGFLVSGGTNTVSITGGNDYLRSCTIQSFSADGVAINGADAKIYGCTIKSGSDDAISITGACSVSVAACTLQSCNTGVEVSSSGVNLTVDRCFMTGLGGRGITLTQGMMTVTNCLFTSASGAVGVGSTSTNSATIWNCTSVGCGSTAFNVEGGTVTLKNCIITNVGTGLKRTGGTLTHSNNLYDGVKSAYSGTPAGSGDILADPKFVGGGSYNLQASSPAINAGANGSSVTYYDMDLVYRPQGGSFDIGCYERPSTLSPANTPYSNTFEAPMGGEWSATNRASGAAFTNFAGRHGNNKLTLALNTKPGANYKILFDWYGIDSWEGNDIHQAYGPDRFNVAVNGSSIFSHTFTWEWSYPSSYPVSPDQVGYFGFNTSYKDAIFRKVGMTFTATANVSYIDFYGDGLQGIDDESWGIDNITVSGSGVRIKKWREVPNPALMSP